MHIRIKNGLDIPLAGEPEQKVYPGQQVSRVAVCGRDYPGLKPRVLVASGEPVTRGQALFIDKRDPAVKYTAPGSGTVVAINRGARRCLESVVIRLEEDSTEKPAFEAATDEELQHIGREEIVSRLAESGCWTAFRTRPFSQVPNSGSVARSIFVTAIDTQPLAADPCVVIGQHVAAFNMGLCVLSRLTQGTVWLCTARGWDIQAPESARIKRVGFSGPHPAGLVGTHIHFLDPVGSGRTVWHIAYQDVIAIGTLFASGSLHTERIIALAGDPLIRPRLIRTRLGASIGELVAGEIEAGEIEAPEGCRIISGSLLTGRTAPVDDLYLGRYHNQVSVIREGGQRRLFGWLGLPPSTYTACATFLKRSGHRRRYALDTSQNGRPSGILPLRVFEKVMPLDILPSMLFRALAVGDTDQAQSLGCLELDEEDLALCSFVCPAKSDYGAWLRANLDQIGRAG